MAMSPRLIRRAWEEFYGRARPKEPNGANYQAHHMQYRSNGGSDEPENIQPMTKADHVELHQQRGDFARWGRQSSEDSFQMGDDGEIEPPDGVILPPGEPTTFSPGGVQFFDDDIFLDIP